MSSALSLPPSLQAALQTVHASWRPVLESALQKMLQQTPDYFPSLFSAPFLPTRNRLFAAFSRPLESTRYILIGEGPYPREQSATGVCFMDGAVDGIWAEQGSGLSKKVNRATSLRNFIKMLLVAQGDLDPQHTSGDALAVVAQRALSGADGYIQQLAELQSNLERQGFLLLNATLVFRDHVAPAKDGQAWRPFLSELLSQLSRHFRAQNQTAPVLVLWGKIAAQLNQIEALSDFPRIEAEHPYNLSFIKNKQMQDLFLPMHLLSKQAA